MRRIVQENIKRQKHQTSVKNVMFMSAKTVSSNCFFVDILLVLKSVAFTWCQEWVRTVQTML